MTEIAVFGAVWALVWRLAAHTTVGAIGLIGLLACLGWMFTRWLERGRFARLWARLRKRAK
jgi:hypothetical protein